ncbi:AbrB/MazE/SpoVT family DNA-binding domain-containing protein [Haladaptatus sp. NG-WS-4]
METRKVQYTGSSTTISLPKEWAEEHGVEAGMQLALYPAANGELIIGAQQVEDADPPRVDIDSLSATDIRRMVTALYAIGNDTFVLTSQGEIQREQRHAVESAAGDLVGLEVRRESESEIALDSLVDARAMSMERIILQLQYTALSMHQDAVHGLVDGDEEIAARVAERRSDVERRAAIAESCFQRTLTNVEELDRLGHPRPVLFDQYTTARTLTDVAEQAQTIASLVGERTPIERLSWADEFERYARDSRTLTEAAVEAVLAADEPPHETVRTAQSLVDDVIAFRRRTADENDETYVRAVAAEAIERTARSSVDVARPLFAGSDVGTRRVPNYRRPSSNADRSDHSPSAKNGDPG